MHAARTCTARATRSAPIRSSWLGGLAVSLIFSSHALFEVQTDRQMSEVHYDILCISARTQHASLTRHGMVQRGTSPGVSLKMFARSVCAVTSRQNTFV